MQTIAPGDRFVRVGKRRRSEFECRAVQSDAFNPQGGVALFCWSRSGFERLVPLDRLDRFLATATREG
jgi:hypothetical protein